jgi:pyruvate dehydrogenase E1 component alpha subunit
MHYHGDPVSPETDVVRVLREDGSVDPALDPPLDGEARVLMYRHMLRARLIDERMTARQRQGKVSFWGTCTGQEAVPVAAAMALHPNDWIFPALREGAAMLVRGFPLGTWLAQAYGNARDPLKGRQMPSHPSGRSVHQVAWSSCIGPQLPQAVGAAYAARRKGHDTVVVGFMGDGATSENDFHAALTFAGVWRVPCVLVCQNNQWAISVPVSRQSASDTLAIKARSYGLPGVRVDGNDGLAVHRVVDEAASRARRGDGPTLIEAVTYRMGPHSSSDDPSRYRDGAEVDRWRARDPIERLRRHLRQRGLLDDAGLDDMARAIHGEIAAALDEVEPLPPPPRASLFDDVYAETPWHLREAGRGITPRG